MTIEKEALIIAKNFQGTKMDSYAFALLQEQVGKALQKKQDRILELEEKVREYKWEWESACERERATNERVKELESALKDVTYSSYALTKFIHRRGESSEISVAHKKAFEAIQRAKKAIGGGNEKGN